MSKVTAKEMFGTAQKIAKVDEVKTALESKHKKVEQKRKLMSEITTLNKEIFGLVNEDYKKISELAEYKTLTKLQKLAVLRGVYTDKDEIFNIVVTLKELNLNVPNDLSIGRYRTIITAIKKGVTSKSKVNKIHTMTDDKKREFFASLNKKLKASK